MLPEIGQVGPIVIRTYTLLLDIAILLGLGMLVWQGWHTDGKPDRWLDIGLLALVGGIVGGRLEHIAIHWAYFVEHPDEIVQIWRGGLGWHAAVLLGLLLLAIGCAVGKIRFGGLADTLSLAVPLGSLLIYAGCLANRCGHGREVESLADYPPFLALELPDMYGIVAPRLASQLYGVVFSIILLIIALLFVRWTKRPGARLWPLLVLLGLETFCIGFTRGDSNPMVGPLRLDQILDLGIVLIGIVGMLRTMRRPRVSKAPASPARRFDIIKS